MVLAVAATAFAGVSTAGGQKTDLDVLQGNWQVTSIKDSDMKDPPDDFIKFFTVNFKKDVMTISAKGMPVVTFKVKLDPSKKPKTIDCTHSDEKDPDKGKVEPGIYKIEGDVVTICTNSPDSKERPAAFAIKAGTRIQVVTMKKAK